MIRNFLDFIFVKIANLCAVPAAHMAIQLNNLFEYLQYLLAHATGWIFKEYHLEASRSVFSPGSLGNRVPPIVLLFILTGCSGNAMLSANSPAAAPAPKIAAAAAPRSEPDTVDNASEKDASNIRDNQILAESKLAASNKRRASAKQGSKRITADRTATANSPLEPPRTIDVEKVKAVLSADPTIYIPGPPGDLRVSIGDQDFASTTPAGMVSATGVIVTPVKPKTVRVTPNAPAFDVTPKAPGLNAAPDNSICAAYDPTGSTVSFELVPKSEQSGKFRVGANVFLYSLDNCNGTPIPKATADLQVEVVVKALPIDLKKTVREGISRFWIGFVGLIVALLLFLTRNFLKRIFGFEEK